MYENVKWRKWNYNKKTTLKDYFISNMRIKGPLVFSNEKLFESFLQEMCA